MAAPKISGIEQLTSAVFDNGRRGEPLPGCDCERCFGYCLRDRDVATHRAHSIGAHSDTARGRELDFGD